MPGGVAVAAILAVALACAPSASAAVTLPPDFADQPIATLGAPTALAFTPDGRMLITTQPGRLRVLSGGSLLPAPALDLSGKTCSNSERGLLGVAVDPGFALNRFIYLFYTWNKFGNTCPTGSTSNPVNRVSRFTLADTNTVDPASELVLVDNMPSPAGNHNAGDLQFRKDGNLYVTIGDGGCDYAGGGCAGSNPQAGQRDLRDQAERPDPRAERHYLHGAAHLGLVGGVRPHRERSQPGQLRVRLVVGRRRGYPHDPHAGDSPDLRGDVPQGATALKPRTEARWQTSRR